MKNRTLVIGQEKSGLTSGYCIPAIAQSDMPVIFFTTEIEASYKWIEEKDDFGVIKEKRVFDKMVLNEKLSEFLESCGKRIVIMDLHYEFPRSLNNSSIYCIDSRVNGELVTSHSKVNVEEYLDLQNIEYNDALIVIDKASDVVLGNINNVENIVITNHNLLGLDKINVREFFDDIIILSLNCEQDIIELSKLSGVSIEIIRNNVARNSYHAIFSEGDSWSKQITTGKLVPYYLYPKALLGKIQK